MLKRLREIIYKVLSTRAAWPILICISLLCVASILALELSSPDRADRQRLFITAGTIVLILSLIPHFQVIGRASYVLFGVSILLLVGVLAMDPIKGARRWFQLPGDFQLQASELAKIAFVMAMAWYLRYRRNVRELTGLIIPLMLTFVPFALIVVEPDLGTALLFPLVLYAMLIAAGARFRHMLIIALLAVIALPGAYPLLNQYQQRRIQTVVLRVMGKSDPKQVLKDDYQLHQSLTAIGSGGATGQGSEGAQHIKQGLLPEAYTDFIFAVICTQWGFVGGVVVLLLYLAFFGAAVEIAASTKDPFGRLMVIGLSSLIIFQTLINIAMTVGLGPVVGISLPFLSYGGSSLVTSMLAAGLLLNVSVRRQSKSVGSLESTLR